MVDVFWEKWLGYPNDSFSKEEEDWFQLSTLKYVNASYIDEFMKNQTSMGVWRKGD
jgi:hypothetical protein